MAVLSDTGHVCASPTRGRQSSCLPSYVLHIPLPHVSEMRVDKEDNCWGSSMKTSPPPEEILLTVARQRPVEGEVEPTRSGGKAARPEEE